MDMMSAIAGFALLAGLAVMVPGIDTVLVLRTSISRGVRSAFFVILGISSGLLVWGISAAVGVAALFAASELAFRVLSILGALYMLYLGASMIIASLRSRNTQGLTGTADTGSSGAGVVDTGSNGAGTVDAGRMDSESVSTERISRESFDTERVDTSSPDTAQANAELTHPSGQLSAKKAFATGLMTNLLNPKVGAFYVAVIPQFLIVGLPPIVMGIILASIHALLALLWFGTVALLATRARRVLSRPAVACWIDRIAGGAIIAFGVKMGLAA